MIIRAILALVMELVTGYILGTLINSKIIRIKDNILTNTFIGFFAYQALMQGMALLAYYVDGDLHDLSRTWCIMVGGVSLISSVLCYKDISVDVKQLSSLIKRLGIYFWAMSGAIILTCFFAATNGVTDADSSYYIALINTTVTTDSLFDYNVYTGQHVDSFYLRRALATFEIHSAVLCQVYQIHALVMARIMRACQNVLLTGAGVYLCGTMLFRKEIEKVHEKACMMVIGFLALQPAFTQTIYTASTFLLNRAYEGKAFSANAIAIFVLYYTVKCVKSMKKRYFLLLALVAWGSTAISASAMIMVPVECAVVLLATYFALRWRKKEEGAV